ncbi:7481_t:CDS:2 [Rhizophagus irregularis]|nr:7481_t:CDS:2 [Rhizophagus irregularis]
MMESCKIVDNNKDYNLVSPHHSNSNSVISGSTQEYMTVAYDYTLREEREEYCRCSTEKFEPRNSKFERKRPPRRLVECRKFKENEDPRYITQTYKFSLDSLNKNYDDDYNARNTDIINRGTVPVVPVDGCKLQ